MIGAPLPPSVSLFSTAALRPLGLPPATAPQTATPWLQGLGATSGVSLRADVAADQRGLSVQEHAQRVLAALVAA